MKRVLFVNGPTLHSKATIPLMVHLAKKGWDVSYKVNRRTVMGVSHGFSDRYVRENPTSVNINNPQSLRFVAKLIGYADDWRLCERRIRFVRNGPFGGFDAMVGTLSDKERMIQLRGTEQTPLFTLGYVHIPYAARVDGPLRSQDMISVKESVFLTDNPFSRAHGFQQIMSGCALVANGYTYLDRVWQYQRSRGVSDEESRWVLIFHPGGYRGELTQPGDSKSVSYARQKRFVERLCVPLINAGLTPVIKVHPLRAKFHDHADVSEIADAVERENGFKRGSILCTGPESWYWEYAFKSQFILTMGSSSIYELWSAGLRNVFVCHFEGRARTQQYQFFRSIALESYQEYLDFIKAESFKSAGLDRLTATVFETYSSLFTGRSTELAYKLVLDEIEAGR